MNYAIITISLITFISTFLWWMLSIKLKDKLHYIMAFAAWILLWIVSFDIIPEIFELANKYSLNIKNAMIAMVLGFMIFHILEKVILIHHNNEDRYCKHKHPEVWHFSALAIISHSLMDWIWIGLWFQINAGIWVMIAIAVISHNFTDGMNTISLMLVNNNTLKTAKKILAMASIAPTVGIIISNFISLNYNFLFIYLGLFAWFLLYIWASDILPEAHSEKSSYKLIILTILWILFIYITTTVLERMYI